MQYKIACPAANDLDNDRVAVYFGKLHPIGAFVAPIGDDTRLVKNPDGTYSRLYNDGTRVDFSGGGLQTSIADANGNRTAYAYNGVGQLKQTVFPDGTSVKLDASKALGLNAMGVDLGGPARAAFVPTQARISRLQDQRGNVAETEAQKFAWPHNRRPGMLRLDQFPPPFDTPRPEALAKNPLHGELVEPFTTSWPILASSCVTSCCFSLSESPWTLAACQKISRSGRQSPDASTLRSRDKAPACAGRLNAVLGPWFSQPLPVCPSIQSHLRLELRRVPLADHLAYCPVLCHAGNS